VIVLYDCGTQVFTERGDHIFMVFETKVLRKVFESRKGKVKLI
jgi:hypothetical protein